MTAQTTFEALDSFRKRFLGNIEKHTGNLPTTEKDDQWPSPCETGPATASGDIHWQPVPADNDLSFRNVEQALGLELHEDIKTYFTSFYSDNLAASADDGRLELLLPWNRDDFLRLQENLIGHIHTRRRLKKTITVFFAVTDMEETYLSVVNDTGEVWAENVGQQPHRKLADNLADFLNTIQPQTE